MGSVREGAYLADLFILLLFSSFSLTLAGASRLHLLFHFNLDFSFDSNDEYCLT